MSDTVLEPTLVAERPDISHIETEDDTPVDNFPSAKQQRLLTEPLYTSQPIDFPFLVDANIGVFYQINSAPAVPDVLLSLGVAVADDWWAKENRSYFVWEFGKPPDVVIEIVSNKKGGELDRKLNEYAQIGARYYVVYDPQQLIQDTPLRVYELHVRRYVLRPDYLLEEVDLALTLWDGVYEGKQARWLRWCDLNGVLVLTGAEQAAYERQRADEERQRADEERQRADEERQRADEERQRTARLIAQLRALGVDPEL